MAGQISRDFIDAVLSRTDIVELISSRISLKKKGNSYLACCPFHGEKTPSFNVSASKQFYHCFGCGVSGDAIKFIREYEHLEFFEAVEELAERVGLEVPKFAHFDKKNTQANKLSLYQLLDIANQFYRTQLKQQNAHSELSQYIKKRQLSPEIIELFQIGFSPDSWSNILDLFKQQKAESQQQIDTGLIIFNEEKNKSYDRFRNRLMFPIRDRRGKIIGFGGRIIGKEEGQAKYINSPETPLFHKSNELYGFYELQQAVRHIKRILVVEGYMDVVALAQLGIPYAVATLGTATTAQHIEKLFRASKEVIYCFDGDRAGKDAAWKALTLTLPLIQPDRQVKFMFLPDGEDPDSLVRQKGCDEFENIIDNAMPLSEFLFSALQEKVDTSHADGRSQLIDLAKPYIQSIPADSSFFLLMKDKLAKLTGISLQELNPVFTPVQQSNKQLVKQPVKTQTNSLSAVWKAIAYLLNYPHFALEAGDPDKLSSINKDGIVILIRLLDILQYDPNISTARLFALWDNENEKILLNNIALKPLLIDDEKAIFQEFIEILSLLEQEKLKREFENLQFIQNNQGLTKAQTKEYKQLLELQRK